MKRIAVIVILVLFGQGIFLTTTMAQQDPLFTQYLYAKLLFNPATAGSRNVLAADLLTRFQWTGINGAPQTTCISASTPLKNPHIALGFYAYRDALGPTIDYNLMGTFAYRILFRKSRLSFGISAGLKYYNIDWGALTPRDQGDPALIPDASNRAVPDIDFGVYYDHPNYYIGLSVRHLLQNQIVISNTLPTDEDAFTKLLRNFYAIGGGHVVLAPKFDLMPSLLIKYVAGAPVQADISARILYRDLLMLGLSYRTEQAIGVLVGINLGKGFSIGYSFDFWMNALQGYNRGSHELRLSYELDIFHPSRMLTPRYF